MSFREPSGLYRQDADWRGRGALGKGGEAVSDVVAVAGAGQVMPQKSTYFYPKPASGIVFNPLDAAIQIPAV